MGILAWIKLGAAAALALLLVAAVLQYKHMKAVIAAQEIKIASLEIEREVLKKKIKTEANFAKKKDEVRAQVSKDEDAVAPVIDSGNADAILKLFGSFRMHNDQVHPSPGR